MPRNNVKSTVLAKQTLRSQAMTSTTNGTGVDTLGFGNAMVLLEVGAVTGTSPTMDVKLQDSPDNSTFTDISGATLTQVTAANKSQTLSVNLDGKARYIRAVATIAGTSPSFTAGCEILLGKGEDYAVANPAA